MVAHKVARHAKKRENLVMRTCSCQEHVPSLRELPMQIVARVSTARTEGVMSHRTLLIWRRSGRVLGAGGGGEGCNFRMDG